VFRSSYLSIPFKSWATFSLISSAILDTEKDQTVVLGTSNLVFRPRETSVFWRLWRFESRLRENRVCYFSIILYLKERWLLVNLLNFWAPFELVVVGAVLRTGQNNGTHCAVSMTSNLWFSRVQCGHSCGRFAVCRVVFLSSVSVSTPMKSKQYFIPYKVELWSFFFW